MNSSEWVGLSAVFVALAFQGFVTYRVWRSRVFERGQKLAQSKLIWLLPVLGAVMVFSVLHGEERRSWRPRESRLEQRPGNDHKPL
jgi:hypothetical protein